MHHIIERDRLASHITISEIDAIDLTDVELVHVTGIPPALSPKCKKSDLPFDGQSKGGRNIYYI